jgi:cytochrome b561
MAGPAWLAYTFAGVMIITAAYCVSRLVTSRQQHRPTDHQVDGVHVLMGVAMAGMLVPRLRVFWAGGWETVFGAAAAWFAWQAIRGLRSQDAAGRGQRHHLQHALACAAMLYMFLAASSSKAVAGGSAMSGMAGGGAHFPTLALVLAFALLGYVVWTTDRLPSLAPVAAFAAPSMPVPVLVGATASSISAGDTGGSTLQDEDQARAGRGWGPPVSPRLAACCEIAMGVTMGYALILML